MKALRLSPLLGLLMAGAGLGAQTPAPACNPGNDAYATRRAEISQKLASVSESNRSSYAASDKPDDMVLLGNYYAKLGQTAEAQQWWNEAAQRGDALGYEALGDHAGNDLAAKRKFYAQAAQLDDPTADQVYGEMLLKGEGGPAARILGRELVLKGAAEGGISALVVAGGASTGIGTHPYTDVFPKSPALADCFLKAAQARGSVDARRILREAYDAGILTDPLPTPLLSQTSAFLDYLRSFTPEERPAVLQKAIDKDPGSPNATRALEEIAWLATAPAPGSPVSATVDILRAQSPGNATALYFTLRSELPGIPADPYSGKPMLHTQAAYDLGSKLADAGKAGAAALDGATLTLGLDPDAMQLRRVAATKVFQQASALADAVTAGARWISPKSADDVIDDYIEERGGLAALQAVNTAHLALNVSFTTKDKDAKSWVRETFVARDEVAPWHPVTNSSDDTFSVPDLQAHTHEVVINNGHGWEMKNDNGPVNWAPEVVPDKRGKGVPPEFGGLHAPAAGDLAGPLVEYARLRAQHPAFPRVRMAGGLQRIDGLAVYQISVVNSSDTVPDYDVYVDSKTYQLVRIEWQWVSDKVAFQLDYSGYQRPAGSALMVPRECTLTTTRDNNHDNDTVEVDTLLQLVTNPQGLDPQLFSLTKDDAKKIKDVLEQHANDDKSNE